MRYALSILTQRMAFLLLFTATGLTSCNGQQVPSRKVDFTDSTSALPAWQPLMDGASTHLQISQVVRMMFQDSRSRFWFGTQNGAFVRSGDSLIHVDGIQSERGQGITIKDMVEDGSGAIWVGHTGGLSKVDVRSGSVINYYEVNGLLSKDVWCVEATRDGRIWIGTDKGLCVFDGQHFTRFPLPEGRVDSTLAISTSHMIHDLLEDRYGTLWICTNAGLFSLADEQLSNASKQHGISTPFVHHIWESPTGTLWVSARDGLYKITESGATCVSCGKIEVGKGIGSVVEDESGTIWFVANQHHLYTYDGTDFTEVHLPRDAGDLVVFQIFSDASGRLWFVGMGGVYRLENDHILFINRYGPW